MQTQTDLQRPADVAVRGDAAHAVPNGNVAYAAGLAAVAGFVLVGYTLTDPPLFNPSASVDPWLYTAAFRNLGYVYSHWGATYYVSRLPWIIPGRIAYGLFPPRTAYYLLHLVYGLGGAIFLSLLLRRYFGSAVALAGYAALIASPIYYNAHYWDYVDGPELTYLLAALYFGLARPGGRRRFPYAILCGFFALAAITTVLYAAFFVAAMLLAYFVLELTKRMSARRIAIDCAGFALGMLLLLVVCGTFSVAHGQRFLFFMPQVDILRQLNQAQYRNPNYDWAREPRVLAPLFVLVLLAALWRGRRFGPAGSPERFALASGVYLAATYALLVGWEFFFSGTTLELPDRFDQLDSGVGLCLGGALFFALGRGRLEGARRWAVVGVVGVVALAPLLVVYGLKEFSVVSGRGTVIALIAAGIALVLALALRLGRGQGLFGAIVATALVFGVNWAFAASHEVEFWYRESGTVFIVRPGARNAFDGTRIELSTHKSNRATYDLGLDLMDYLKRTGVERSSPDFWYSLRELPFAEGVQSLYYYSYTYLGVDMPNISADFRFRMKVYHPRTIVLLCRFRACRGAPAVLRRAGYPVRATHSVLLAAGAERMWVRVFERTGS